MNLYLDDDSVAGLLVKLLRAAGHDVQIPADVGKVGAEDAAHFMHAIRSGRTVLTSNHDDFKLLHDLVLLVAGHHPGVFVVRRDNDPKRDMSAKAIVRAIGRLTAAAVVVADEFHVLNHYR